MNEHNQFVDKPKTKRGELKNKKCIMIGRYESFKFNPWELSSISTSLVANFPK